MYEQALAVIKQKDARILKLRKNPASWKSVLDRCFELR